MAVRFFVIHPLMGQYFFVRCSNTWTPLYFLLSRFLCSLRVIPGGYYYPNFFGTLAATAGLEHSFLYLGEDVTYHYYNVTVRNPDEGLCPPIELVRHAVIELIFKWNHCCDKVLQQQWK